MAYVFRLNTEGTNTITGWGNSSKYGSQVIDQIKDPNGASASREITSIPSPFARIDLVKTAFKMVSQKDKNGKYHNITGSTIYHKMVSDSLDVAQIFFEYGKLSDKIEIIPWDAKNDLNALLQSKNTSHKQLGQTYDLFWKQDAATYNFGKVQRIYMLNYINGPEPLNIIGATSPATLFFCSANDLDYASRGISFGNDRPFDGAYKPLHERDIDFHKYLWNLSLDMPSFATLFPEVYEYLQASYSVSDDGRKNALRSLSGDMTIYDSMAIAGNAGNTVEILGYPLMQARSNVASIPQVSDFVIDSPLYEGNNPPLVLPVEMFTKKLIYVRDPWDKDTKVPYSDRELWKDRTLPDDGSKYPYLTISDFLEDYIIRTPYEMKEENRSKYFDGNLIDIKDACYLLPLKDLFFEFFTVDQLQNGVKGKKLIEIKKNAGGVHVLLRIPIKGGNFIEYSRLYFDGIEPDIEKSNKGAVVEHDFAFAMMPMVKFANDDNAFYRFGFIQSASDQTKYTVSCMRGARVQETILHVRNVNDARYPKATAMALDGRAFDYIKVGSNKASGVIVPKLQSQNGGDKFSFAIDFGTTNTHIEYKVNNGVAKEFDINPSDMQMLPYAEYGLEQQVVFESEFLPSEIGEKYKYNFPMRTAITEAKNTDWKQAVLPMVHAGFAYTYEKLQEYKYNRIITNLKWSNDVNNIQKVNCYIESLMILLRNKVALNNGNLPDTKIVWFYPISMTRARFNNFKKEWEVAYVKYFGGSKANIQAMTESVAPYEHYHASNNNVNNIVTIDVGGGTTDVVVAQNNNVDYITSFRFAANAIFGDAYAQGGAQNGIVNQFKKQMREVLEANVSTESQLLQVFDQLDADGTSADLASFLFSLKDNVNNKQITKQVDFNTILQNDDKQKLSFLIFYSAIIYHIAHIMKIKNLEMPRHIAFSGNGSKVISILSTDESTLSGFSKLIFEKVYGQKYGKNGLNVLHNANQPKEATCKGGLQNTIKQDYDDVKDLKVVLDSASYTEFLPLDFTYKKIDEKYIVNTVNQVEKYFKFMFDLDKDFSYRDNFGVDPESIQIAKGICVRDLETFTKRGVEARLSEVDEDTVVEETLFFYPLVGVLNALAAEVCSNN